MIEMIVCRYLIPKASIWVSDAGISFSFEIIEILQTNVRFVTKE